jgi:ERCC4-type nuclease
MSEWCTNTGPAKVKVVADFRESKSGVIDFFQARDDVEVETRYLRCGDYVVDEKLLFERKTLLDFASSIKNGRLFELASKLFNSNFQAIFIIEGTSANLSSSQMRREALQGALITLSIVFRIPVLRSLGPEESARLMLYAARQVKSLHYGAFPHRGKRPKGKRRIQLSILREFPGVGAERAGRLLDRFGSVEAVLTSSLEELRTIPGIGQHTAEMIHWAVRENEAEYLTEGEWPMT